MAGEIDFDAGGILQGVRTVEEAGDALFEALVAVASGQPTKSEEIAYTRPVDLYVRGPVL